MAQDTIQYLVLHRCDPSCNMARYYVLSIEPSLFGDATLIREWGRITEQASAGSSSMKTILVHWKPSRPGSSESSDAAICYKVGRAGVQGNLLVSA
jgi:predicted DNA-binding WGR domain protein